MKPSTGTVAAESVFPALDIIRRAGPPEASRDELYVLVAEYLGSPVWHVRDMAARALCSFMLNDKWVSALESIIFSQGRSAKSLHANRLHGVLLTAKFVFERLTDVSPDLARSMFIGKAPESSCVLTRTRRRPAAVGADHQVV